MAIIHCCVCQIAIPLTDEQERQLRDCHNTFYCINGHGQHFTGESEADKLREEVRSLTGDRDYWKARAKCAEAAERHIECRYCGLLGYVAKLRKRIGGA